MTKESHLTLSPESAESAQDDYALLLYDSLENFSHLRLYATRVC